MKKNKLTVFLMLFAACLGFSGLAFAGDAEDQQKMIEEKRAELNDHEWEVNLTSSADRTKVVTDTLVFKEQKFESKKLSAEGVKPTNYTVSLQEGGPTVWESMQSTADGKSVSWRGEWQGDSMNGIMSKQSGDGKSEDYHFSSTSSKVIEKAPEPVAAPVAEAVAPVAEEAAQQAEQVVSEAEKAVENAVEKAAEVAPVVEAPVAAAVEAAAPVQEEVKQEAPKKKKRWF